MDRGTTERLAMIMDYSGWIRKETAVDFKRGHSQGLTDTSEIYKKTQLRTVLFALSTHSMSCLM